MVDDTEMAIRRTLIGKQWEVPAYLRKQCTHNR